jgi:diacylglycerol kinase family enzyme
METSPNGPDTPSLPSRLVVIVNPSKKRADLALALIRAYCRDTRMPRPRVLQTTVEEPGGAQAREAIATGAELVIVAGGDGTVREVASVLSGTGIPMGVVPIGTANLLSRNLGLRPQDLDANVRHAITGHDRTIDIGRIWLETPDHPHEPYETVFLVVAGFGMDAAAISQTSEVLKRRLGWVAYFDSLVRRVFEVGEEIAITLDDGIEEHIELRTLMVGNCGLIPAGIRLIPDAILDDGQLDVVIMTPTTPIGWIPIAGKILLRHRYKIDDLHHRPATSVIARPTHPLAVQLDGDVVDAVSCATIRIEPASLRVRSTRRPPRQPKPRFALPWQPAK